MKNWQQSGKFCPFKREFPLSVLLYFMWFFVICVESMRIKQKLLFFYLFLCEFCWLGYELVSAVWDEDDAKRSHIKGKCKRRGSDLILWMNLRRSRDILLMRYLYRESSTLFGKAFRGIERSHQSLSENQRVYGMCITQFDVMLPVECGGTVFFFTTYRNAITS